MIDRVDVALPMVYPSHYWRGSFGFNEPNAYPYEVVLRALRDAQRKSARVEGAGTTRPWLQDFSLGQPPYAAAEVRARSRPRTTQASTSGSSGTRGAAIPKGRSSP
jgi:hypothetical protein